MAHLSGHALPPDATPVALPLPRNLPSADQWLPLIEQNPALTRQRLAAEHFAKQPDDSAWHQQVEANFTIAQRLDWRSDLPGTGSGLAAGVTFEVPLAALTRDGRSSTSQLRYRAAVEQARDTRRRLLSELEQGLTRYQQQLAQLETQQAALALSEQLLEERSQRLDLDGEAGFMNLRSARADIAENQRNLIDAWHDAWQVLAELQLLADESIPATAGQAPLEWQATRTGDQPAREADWKTAVYLWQSAPLLEPETRADTLAQLVDAGFTHIYLGLTAGQIANSGRLTHHMETLAAELRRRQISLDLLLGDPAWISGTHRADLLTLINQLAHLPFRHLHLDLEVEQLGWPVPRARLQDWLDTLESVTRVSPWPVTLVSHHRWFAPGQKTADPCVPCRLPELGVNAVTLMLYSTAEASVSGRMAAMIEAWPDLNLTLAQSVERALPAENSWHGSSAEDLAQLGQRLKSTLAPSGLAGVAWQDWADYPKPNP